jgi:hypothetical protein
MYTRYANLIGNAAEAGRFEVYMISQNITLADALKEMLQMDETARRDALLRPRYSTSSNGRDHNAHQVPTTNGSNGNGNAIHSDSSDVGDIDVTDGEETVIAPPSAPAVPPEPIAWGVDTRVCVECVSRVLEYVTHEFKCFQAITLVMIQCVGPSLTSGGFENGQKVF